MFTKYILFLLGVILVSSSLVFIIIYLNLLNMGYSFLDYVNFIIRRLECLNLIIGLILLIIINKQGKEKIK